MARTSSTPDDESVEPTLEPPPSGATEVVIPDDNVPVAQRQMNAVMEQQADQVDDANRYNVPDNPPGTPAEGEEELPPTDFELAQAEELAAAEEAEAES